MTGSKVWMTLERIAKVMSEKGVPTNSESAKEVLTNSELVKEVPTNLALGKDFGFCPFRKTSQYLEEPIHRSVFLPLVRQIMHMVVLKEV